MRFIMSLLAILGIGLSVGCAKEATLEFLDLLGAQVKQVEHAYVPELDVCVKQHLEAQTRPVAQGFIDLEEVDKGDCVAKPVFNVKGELGAKLAKFVESLLELEGERVFLFSRVDLCMSFKTSFEGKKKRLAWQEYAVCPEDAVQVDLGLAKKLGLKKLKEVGVRVLAESLKIVTVI